MFADGADLPINFLSEKCIQKVRCWFGGAWDLQQPTVTSKARSDSEYGLQSENKPREQLHSRALASHLIEFQIAFQIRMRSDTPASRASDSGTSILIQTLDCLEFIVQRLHNVYSATFSGGAWTLCNVQKAIHEQFTAGEQFQIQTFF